MNRVLLKLKISLSVLCFLSGTVQAAQTIHFDQDFTDNSIADEVGSIVSNTNPNVGLHAQQSWRNASQSYYGHNPATAFDGTPGFPPGVTTMSLANTPVLQSGNVWVFDISMIADVATSGSESFGLAPGVVIEAAGWNGFTSGALMKLGPNVSNGSGDDGMVLAAAYPNGIDDTVQPTSLGNSLAGVGTGLDSVLRAKYVFQGIAGADTRVSTQVLNGSTPVGTAAKTEGGGSFRSDYSDGLIAQFINGHPGTNVSYATNVPDGSTGGTDKTDVSYVAAATNLQIGLTHLTFKQVSQADSNTDGQVNLADGSTLVGNWNPGGSGKSFFQGDANGDGQVDLNDGSLLVSQWTAAADNAAAGTATATYVPSTGHVLLDANGIAFWQLSSPSLFIGAPNDLDATAGVRWTVPGTVKQADSSVIGELALSDSIVFDNVFNFGTFQFEYSGLSGDLGQLLPIGLTPQDLAGTTFSYNTLGGQQVTVDLFPVPEPASVGVALVGFAGVLGIGLRLRRTADGA